MLCCAAPALICCRACCTIIPPRRGAGGSRRRGTPFRCSPRPSSLTLRCVCWGAKSPCVKRCGPHPACPPLLLLKARNETLNPCLLPCCLCHPPAALPATGPLAALRLQGGQPREGVCAAGGERGGAAGVDAQPAGRHCLPAERRGGRAAAHPPRAPHPFQDVSERQPTVAGTGVLPCASAAHCFYCLCLCLCRISSEIGSMSFGGGGGASETAGTAAAAAAAATMTSGPLGASLSGRLAAADSERTSTAAAGAQPAAREGSVNSMPAVVTMAATGAGATPRSVAAPAGSVLATLRRVPGNAACCDCGAPDPDWASLNLGVLLCIECRSVGGWVGGARRGRACLHYPACIAFLSRSLHG